MLRIPHCLDNRLTDGGEVVSLTRRSRSTPQKYYISASGTHLCYRLSKSQDLVRLKGLGKLKKFIHLIGSRPRYLPAFSTVPQLLSYRVPHISVCVCVCVRACVYTGVRGSVVGMGLCYKSEGRGFDTGCSDFFNLPNPSGRTRP
jgi:hypothetical protein